MRRLLLAATVAIASLLPAAAFAGARDTLDSFTRDLKGLDGRFAQRVFDGNGRVKESSSGRVALSAPRLFRWEYEAPYPQLIVADGERVWVYDPDLEQVTVRPQGEEERNSPLATLIEPGRLDREFDVSQEAAPVDGLHWMTLTPKRERDSGFQSARLGFDDRALVRMEVVDALGQRTEIAFSDWRKNPRFDDGTFRFSPPEGVDVIGE